MTVVCIGYNSIMHGAANRATCAAVSGGGKLRVAETAKRLSDQGDFLDLMRSNSERLEVLVSSDYSQLLNS